jgi:peptide-methionine (S)-S-oxide reductase
MKEAKVMTHEEEKKMEIATLAGGCFWCVEAVFNIVKGVEKVTPGYTGGHLSNPTYEQVSTGTTGHAEAAQITFNPETISYKEILEIFFATHNPTTINQQGPDVGTQYRSAIFYQNEQQKTTANQVINELNREEIWDKPIVTQVEQLRVFYPAESYHKDYFKRNPNAPYCQAVITPKILKLQHRFLSKLKTR